MATLTLNQNPSNKSASEASKADRSGFKRIPMSAPRRKMETPDLPGFHLHWMLEENIPQAFQGGYEFVKTNELDINPMGIGSDTTLSGNVDMGTNICIVGNKVGNSGKPDMQYLMKIKLEWWNEDQKSLEDRNIAMLRQMFRGEQIAGSEKTSGTDQNLRYVDRERTGIAKPLFNRPARKSAT